MDLEGGTEHSAGVELPPVAPMLMESLRAVGYSTSAALADLVDNSIAAGATKVEITFSGADEPFVAIIDDGDGMTQDELILGMRYGSRDPRDARAGLDLGRFGLGMKTASLSQCRRMDVVSVCEGEMSIAAWDLDVCEQRQSWWLETPNPEVIPAELRDALSNRGHGTAVLWRKLDRIFETPLRDPRYTLDQTMDMAADHLALVFHRFMANEFIDGFDITINGRSLPRLDPFLVGHTKGQSLHPESFDIDGHEVTVSPFVLPFPSRLKPTELHKVGGRESLKTGHGFYIYRGGRLVVQGGWFRIVPADELVRLARVRVDVPVELDHHWKVDIRKTAAEPPTVFRPHLRRIVGQATTRSRRVYTHKGTPQIQGERIPLWVRHDLRDGAAVWKLNREHPLMVVALREGASPQDVSCLLDMAEALLPAYDIHLHISNDLPVSEPAQEERELKTLAEQLMAAFKDDPGAQHRLLKNLPFIDPFNRAVEKARSIAEGLMRNAG